MGFVWFTNFMKFEMMYAAATVTELPEKLFQNINPEGSRFLTYWGFRKTQDFPTVELCRLAVSSRPDISFHFI